MMEIQNHRHMVVDHSSSGLDRTHWCSDWFSDVPPPKAGGKQHLERRMKAAFKGWSRRRDEAPSAKTVAERGRVLWQMAVMSLMPPWKVLKPGVPVKSTIYRDVVWCCDTSSWILHHSVRNHLKLAVLIDGSYIPRLVTSLSRPRHPAPTQTDANAV